MAVVNLQEGTIQMPNKKLKKEHQTYINKWKNNAKAFDAQKCYSWMAQKILTNQIKLILDIGCGDGAGLQALLSKNYNNQLKIIAIDENLDCLKEAQRKLLSKDYSTELIERCDIIHDNKYHGYNFKSIDKVPEQQVTLIHSDLLSDPYIEPYLNSIGKFDAIKKQGQVWGLQFKLFQSTINYPTFIPIQVYKVPSSELV